MRVTVLKLSSKRRRISNIKLQYSMPTTRLYTMCFGIIRGKMLTMEGFIKEEGMLLTVELSLEPCTGVCCQAT